MKFSLFNFLSKKVTDAEIEAAGYRITSQIWLKELALQIVTSYIANTISKCEIKTYVDGVESRDELYYLLNVNPNPNQSSSQFVNMVLEKYVRNGAALVVPYKKHIYCADGFSVDQKPLRDDVFTSVSVEDYTIPRSFRASDVFYFKLENLSAKAFIDGLYSDYGDLMAIAMSGYKASNAEKFKLVLESAQAGDAAFAKVFNDIISKNLQTFMENDRSVYVQYRGTDLQRMETGQGTSADDIINIRKEVFEIVSQAYRIPQSMMYGNITNMNEIVRVFLTFCIDPIAQMISEELTRKTTTFDSWKRGTRVVVDTSKINHIDLFDIADNVDKLVSSSFASINELRSFVGLDTIRDDFANQYFITKNYQTSTDAAGGGVENG